MKIVAPAGNMERFYSAVNAGADEIYMGLKGFGARRNAENFTLEEFKQALDYAHERGTRIFLTLNTLMKNVEIEFLYQNFKALYEHGLDAVIVQDLGYFRFLKENFPDIDYHGSTQMTAANHVEANYLKSIGFKRVVLPREMSFEEIKKIRENTDIELEIFVSGALCICYSGNCYMSSFIGGRSGNRGMCAQPCRKFYTSSEGEKGYLLSPKDQLMSFEEIKKLKEIGINSIKIEGRMKEKTYVHEAVTYFKNLIDGVNVKERVSSIFNRGYSKGYFYENRENVMNKNYPANTGKPIGIISGKELLLEENVMLGDGIIYLSKDYETLGGDYINRIEKKNKKEKFNIAFIGGISEEKGLRYLKGLIAEARKSEITIHLFGMAENKKYNTNKQNYIYHGEYLQKDLPNLLLENDIKLVCLMSMWPETYSYTLSESLIAEIPVITFDLGAIAERVKAIDAGWIFPIHSTAKDIFKFILTVKSNIAGEYQKKKENIRHYLKEMKSVKEMADEYARIYNKTINTFPVLAYDTNDTQSKIEFYKKSRELNPSSIKSIQEKKEYKRIKNIIKGSAPFKRAFREMKLYRETYKNSKWRNKILFKFIWYRIICLNTCSTFTKKYY